MRTITLSEKHDAILEAIAPDWLRGERCASRRIEWAIDRLEILLAPTQPDDREDESAST